MELSAFAATTAKPRPQSRPDRLGSLLLAGPGLLWLTLLMAIPCLSLVAMALATRGQYGEVSWTFTLDNLKRLAGFGLFGWTPDLGLILLRSLLVAAITTLLCVALAYPLTFHIASRRPSVRVFWLILIIVPFWTNVVVRAYGWLLILAPQMPPARLAAYLGLIPEGAALYPGSLAVYLGMTTTFLPFMALPLYASVERLDPAIIEAARDLYANSLLIFWKVALPQTRPGLTVGVIMTFVPAMAMFVVTDILGGAKNMLIGNLIQQQFSQARDWPFGATLSLALMFLTLLSLTFWRLRNPDKRESS
ncbi:MAG: ABC transporter permease [Deltaproteobacteria bacterium]|jgi:spermidine/putrescine transport system permease protein|nr:ABC transporter permease [Deltaproteobacteria bacterium]